MFYVRCEEGRAVDRRNDKLTMKEERADGMGSSRRGTWNFSLLLGLPGDLQYTENIAVEEWINIEGKAIECPL